LDPNSLARERIWKAGIHDVASGLEGQDGKQHDDVAWGVYEDKRM
jgi:hypothetical protein